MTRVSVRRERPTVATRAVALVVTMLVVYVLTLNAARPDAVERVSAAPRVTRQVVFEALRRWCVSMGCFEDAERARVEAAGSASAGGAGLVREIDGGWHVLGAIYAGEREARRVASRLKDEGIAAQVLELSAERVAVRITAPEQQIDAIAAADGVLRAQVQQLGTVALQLDRGDIRPDNARTLCALAGTEAAQAGERLAGMPGSKENSLCAKLIEALSKLSKQLDDVAGSRQGDAAAVAGMVRLAEIDGFMRLREIQQELKMGN